MLSVAGYKINIQKSVAFLYASNKQKGKLRNNPIHNCFKNNKIPRNKPNQGCKGLYLENYKTIKKEIEEDTNK